ncbi:hypothetical protein [Saccharopolyspora sp. 5N708]|uniref:hypothetical protein n=1 Tax=Saccharopolyspora sp. 5N708 TaxID=3457424 RepID=UPI003FCFDB8B
MEDSVAALGEVERQRRRLGERFRLPAWYFVLYGAGGAAVLAAPAAMVLLDRNIAIMIVLQLFGVFALCTPVFLVPRLTGVRLPFATSSTYPSVLRTVWVQVGVLAIGTVGVLLLSLNGLALLALAVAAIGGLGAGLALNRVYLGIGRDIAEGKART